MEQNSLWEQIVTTVNNESTLEWETHSKISKSANLYVRIACGKKISAGTTSKVICKSPLPISCTLSDIRREIIRELNAIKLDIKEDDTHVKADLYVRKKISNGDVESAIPFLPTKDIIRKDMNIVLNEENLQDAIKKSSLKFSNPAISNARTAKGREEAEKKAKLVHSVLLDVCVETAKLKTLSADSKRKKEEYSSATR
jgi:hypothetical protein